MRLCGPSASRPPRESRGEEGEKGGDGDEERETLVFPFILIIIMILRFIIRSSRCRDVGEDGEKSRKII